jgi:hypothetical protein
MDCIEDGHPDQALKYMEKNYVEMEPWIMQELVNSYQTYLDELDEFNTGLFLVLDDSRQHPIYKAVYFENNMRRFLFEFHVSERSGKIAYITFYDEGDSTFPEGPLLPVPPPGNVAYSIPPMPVVEDMPR